MIGPPYDPYGHPYNPYNGYPPPYPPSYPPYPPRPVFRMPPPIPVQSGLDFAHPRILTVVGMIVLFLLVILLTAYEEGVTGKPNAVLTGQDRVLRGFSEDARPRHTRYRE